MQNKKLPEGVQDLSHMIQYASYMKQFKKINNEHKRKINRIERNKERERKRLYRDIRRYRSTGSYTMDEETKRKIKETLKVMRYIRCTSWCYRNNWICK